MFIELALANFYAFVFLLSPPSLRTMAAAVPFDTAFAQNVQMQNAQFFEAAMKLGLGAIGLEIGSKMVHFTYDKVKQFWKLDENEFAAAAEQWSQTPSSASMAKRFIIGTEDVAWSCVFSVVRFQQLTTFSAAIGDMHASSRPEPSTW